MWFRRRKYQLFVGIMLLDLTVVINTVNATATCSISGVPGTWQEIDGRVNPQSQIVDPSSGCIIDGYWAPVGTGGVDNILKNDGTYSFRLGTTDRKARAEFTNCYSRTSDIPSGEDVGQLEKIRGIDAFCQNGVQPGDYVQYSYKIRFPQLPTKAIVTQWHGRPDRTLITDRFGGDCKVCWLSETKVADLFDTYEYKKGEFCLKPGQSKPTSATCPTNSRPCIDDRGRVDYCGPSSFEKSADLEAEQGGYPPLSVKFKDDYFYILARSDAAEFTDKTIRCNPQLEKKSTGEPLPLTDEGSQKICRSSPLLKASVLYKERVRNCPPSGCFRKGLISGSEQSFDHPLVVAGKWIEFTYQVKWSTYSPSPVIGEIIVWAKADGVVGWEDKTKIVEWNDQIGRNDELGTYFKMGLYTPSGNPDNGIEVRTKDFEQQKYNWHPIEKRLLGTLPVNPLREETYDISGIVPNEAKEVFVYAYIRTGSGNSDRDLEFQIYTQDEESEYSHYLFAHGYNQSAWSYNSGTFWLPIIPIHREIRVRSIGTALTGNVRSALYVIGYR